MPMPEQPVAVVPAAGRSGRYGSMKLLADVGGMRLLDRTLGSLLESGIRKVIVVVADDRTLSDVPLLGDSRVVTVQNPDPARGMFSSIQTGLAIADGDPIIILPADMPFVRCVTIADVAMRAAATGRPVVAGHGGRSGHPLVLPRMLRDALLALPPATTLRDALERLDARPLIVETGDPGVLRDVDVPADLTNGPAGG
jgi:molybdenum cofactor cytidylyltransferase